MQRVAARGGAERVSSSDRQIATSSQFEIAPWPGVAAAYFTADALERAARCGALGAAAETLRCIWVNNYLQAGTAEAVLEALPDAALVLGYGLLEATPFVAAAVLRSGDELVGDPIGRPLMNMRVRPCELRPPCMMHLHSNASRLPVWREHASHLQFEGGPPAVSSEDASHDGRVVLLPHVTEH